MKTKRLLLIIFAVSVVFVAAVFSGANTAYADTASFSIDKITETPYGGTEAIIAQETWGQNIRIYYETDCAYIRFVQSSGSGWTETSAYYEVTDGKYCLSVQKEGTINVVASVYNNHKELQATLTVNVWNDVAAPSAPYIDEAEFALYHITPFSLTYRIYTDVFSGVDFAASYVSFSAENEDNSLEPTFLASIIPAGRRDQVQTLTIADNGVLMFYLIDNAGNAKEYTYTYSKYGVPDNGEPDITLSTAQYAKSVTVTISWGSGYDDNPYATKKYALISASAAVPKIYTEPLVITTEGENRLIVYYYEDGEEKTVTKIINNVDITAPNQTVMEDSASVSINVMAESPIIFSIKATDRLSGIKSVYFKSGGALSYTSGGYYQSQIMDMHNFTVVAEDNAGNKTEYTYLNGYFDFETLKTANAKYLAAKKSEYSLEGWAKVESACNALSMYLMDDAASTSGIASKARDIDTALSGAITIVNRIVASPSGMDCSFVYTLLPSDTDALKGETISVMLGNAATDKKSEAAELSGYGRNNVYAFSINLGGINNAVKLMGKMGVETTFPVSGAIKLYALSNGELKEVATELTDGGFKFETECTGDFFLVAEKAKSTVTIGGKTFGWDVIGITAGIIVGVCLVGFFATYFILKKVKK